MMRRVILVSPEGKTERHSEAAMRPTKRASAAKYTVTPGRKLKSIYN